MNKKIISPILMVLILFLAPSALFARGVGGGLNPPHDALNNIKCGACHNGYLNLGNDKFGNICTSCHTTGQLGANKPFFEIDAANPYGSVVNGYKVLGAFTNTPSSPAFQTSHNWAGSDINPAAGASPPISPLMTNSNNAGYLTCVRCHNVHGTISSATNSRPFLRMKNNNDEMCRDCHTRRDRSSHMDGTHPINLQYSSIAAKKPDLFSYPPVASDPRNTMKLINGIVQCSTCHGLHYTDSRSGREHTAASAVNNLLSSSKGMLLRTNARGKNAEDINICTNCHKGKMSHNDQIRQQNIQCIDCHSGHVEYDPLAFKADEKIPNKYMIRRYMNISTQYGAVRNVRTFYRYTGSENPNKIAGTDGKEFFREDSGLGVCQGCHNDSDKFVDEHKGGNKLNNVDKDHKNCKDCHNHTGGSFGGGCSNCHGYPPTMGDQRGGTRIPGSDPPRFYPGYAFWSSATAPTKHTYKDKAGWLDESYTPHATHADRTLYAINCEQCHKGRKHNVGTNNYRQVFINKVGIVAGAFAQYSSAGPDGRYDCSSVYCHSNGRGGDFKTVSWKNTKDSIVKGINRCQSCHGDKKNIETDAAVLSGAHQRHAASGQANYTCQNCHGATLRGGFANNSSLIYPAVKHVDGVKNINYSFPNNFNLDDAMGSNNYTNDQQCGNIYCHSNGKGKYSKVTPKWDDPNTGKCGTCHEVRAQPTATTFGIITSNAHFRHLSSVYGPNLLKSVGPLPEDAGSACMRCHTLFGTEEKHVKGSIFGDTRPNSPCYKCHGGWQQGAFKADGGSDKLTWSQKTRVSCNQCHPTGTSPVLGRYSAARFSDTILAPSQINYSTSGHGKGATPFKDKDTSKKIDCSDCHNQNSAHIRLSASDKHSTRLKTESDLSSKFTSFGNYTGRRSLANPVCNSCHWEGQSAAKKVMFTHVTSLSEAANGTPTMACTRCHDVHGSDSGHMVKNKIVFKQISSAVLINYSSAYFITYSSPDSTVVKTKEQKKTFKFIDPVTNRGLCQICHVNTKHFKRGINEENFGPITGEAGKTFVNHTKMKNDMNCLSCHPHTPPPGEGTYAFFPFGKCNKCHGYPPVPKTYKTGHNNYSSSHLDQLVPVPFENQSGSGGSHIVKGHVDPSANPSQGWANCNKCHAESDHLTVSKFEEVKVSMPGLNFSNSIQQKYSSNKLAGTDHQVGTCYNVSCHFQRTPKWGNKP